MLAAHINSSSYYYSFKGSQETFYNYGTRGNTSAHTSGEVWNSFLGNNPGHYDDDVDRSDVRIKDILRVKGKENEVAQTIAPKIKSTTENSNTSNFLPSTTTKAPAQKTARPTVKDNKGK